MGLHDSEKEMSPASERLTDKDTTDDEIIAAGEYSDKSCRCDTSSQQIGFIIQMYLTFGLMGWNTPILGPSLTDLAIRTNSSLEQAANLITCIFSGFLCGGFIVAPLLSRLDTHLNVCICLFITGTATSLYSWFHSLVPMGAFVVLSGTGNNAALVAVSTECLVMMGKKSPSVLQGAMLFLSLFAASVPWLVRPLLSSTNTFSTQENVTIANNVTTSTLTISIDGDNFEQVTNDSRIQYAFLVVGFCILALGVSRLVQFVKGKRTPLQMPKTSPTSSGSGDIHITFCTKVKYVMLFLAFSFLFITIEVSWGMFSAGYVAKYFVVSTKDAALVPFLYWCCMTGSRVFNTIISRWLSPGILSLLASIGIVVTAVALVIVGEDNQTAMLLCSGFTGFFMAPMAAVSVSWLGLLIGPCTTASATSFSGSAVGGMSMGPFIAWLCAQLGYRLYSYANLVLSGCFLLVISLIHVIIRLDARSQTD